MPTSITAVTFDYKYQGKNFESAVFLFDPEDKAESDWVNQPERDFNRLFKSLIESKDLEAGSVSIEWSDSVRPVIPVPLNGNGSGMTCIGDMIKRIAEMMSQSEGFSKLTPTENSMLLIIQRTGNMPQQRASTNV